MALGGNARVHQIAYAGLQDIQPGRHRGKPVVEGYPQPGLIGGQTLVFAYETLQEKVREGGRSLHESIRNHVCHVVILLMPYRGKHRYRTAGYPGSKGIIVEACQVQVRTASTQDQHSIVPHRTGNYPIEGGDDGSRSSVSLHQGLEELDIEYEAIFILGQVLAEIAPACGSGG